MVFWGRGLFEQKGGGEHFDGLAAEGTVGGGEEEVFHEVLPAGVDVAFGEVVAGGLPVVAFEVAELGSVGAEPEGVVADAGGFEFGGEIGPDGVVELEVLGEFFGSDADEEGDALHGIGVVKLMIRGRGWVEMSDVEIRQHFCIEAPHGFTVSEFFPEQQEV